MSLVFGVRVMLAVVAGDTRILSCHSLDGRLGYTSETLARNWGVEYHGLGLTGLARSMPRNREEIPMVSGIVAKLDLSLLRSVRASI